MLRYMIIHWLNNQVQLKGRHDDRRSCQKEERHEILYQNKCSIGIIGYPLSLLSKAENVFRFPSIPKGEIVGRFEYIVVIDVKGVHE